MGREEPASSFPHPRLRPLAKVVQPAVPHPSGCAALASRLAELKEGRAGMILRAGKAVCCRVSLSLGGEK
jgi:hypothetical protein